MASIVDILAKQGFSADSQRVMTKLRILYPTLGQDFT